MLCGGEVQEGDRIEALIESAAERVWRLQPRTIRWPRDAGEATHN